MDADIEEKRRVVIPRWRDFKTTLELGELHSTNPHREQLAGQGSLEEQLADWESNKSLAFATDLVGSGFVLGQGNLAREAAEFIVSIPHSTTLQKRIARQVKDPNFCPQLSVTDDIVNSSSGQIVGQSKELVRKYRALLRNAPRNPVRLVELSRQYAILGSLPKAIRTMDIALGLAPTNRFIVRSAARLLVHAGELDKAHYILRKAPSLRYDPWLLAAEIAIASMKEEKSSHIRLGMRTVEDANYSPFELSELSSALATLEMESANSKLARRLFRQALRKPTENSIAQAEWASRSMQSLVGEVGRSNAPRNFEAPAWSYFQKGEWTNALSQGTNWILDQPFSIAPVVFAGIVASIMENFYLAEDIYRFGLAANPGNSTLTNNLAFVLASNNEPELAEAELEKLDRGSLKIETRIAATATEGLIRFRRGFFTEGRALYIRAIQLAQENSKQNYVFRGLVYLAREEILARSEVAEQSLESAEKEEKEAKSSEHDHELGALLKKLRVLLNTSKTQGISVNSPQ